MKLRLASNEDANSISELITPLASKFIVPGFSPEAKTALLKSMSPDSLNTYLDSGFRYFVAEDAGRIVGAVGTRDDSHLYHLFVDEAFAGRGLGRRLWEKALDACSQAREPGARYTVNSSRFAFEFYRRLGFERSGPDDMRNGVRSTPMTWVP